MSEFVYEVIQATESTPECIKRTDVDGNEAWIPKNLANTDYQIYLASLESAN